jgi:hypothetical protein
MLSRLSSAKSVVGGLMAATSLVMLLSACETASPPPPVSPSAVEVAPPAALAGENTVTATIVSVDRTHRVVVVKAADGNRFTLRASDEVQNLKQLKANEHVQVRYLESMASELKRASAAQSGAAPAATAGTNQTTAVVTVTKVDTTHNSLSFKGAKGLVHTVTVGDPAIQATLKSLKPGKLVELTYSEAVALDIAQVAAPAKTTPAKARK